MLDAKMRPRFKCVIQFLIILFLAACIEWFYFGFNNIDFSVPINDFGGDGTFAILDVENELTGCYAQGGWPYAQDLSMYKIPVFLSGLSTIFVNLCHIFIKNTNLIYNLLLFVIPLVNVIVCYLVMRHFKVRFWLAGLAALTFGFCPFVQARNVVGHLIISCIECVPLTVLLCVWCMEDGKFERPGRKWFRYRRNWIALFFAWMIANNGAVYYPFFACFVLLLTMLCLLFRERRLRATAPPAILIGQIVMWLAIRLTPMAAGILRGYGNVTANNAVRSVGSAIPYMLRIDSLVLSPKGYGVSKIKSIVDTLSSVAAANGCYNENATAYMGIIAVIGFLMLLVCLFAARPDDAGKTGTLQGRLWLLSRLTVGILILSVCTGFGILVNVVIRYIRCYNRISPYLVFCGVFAVALCGETLLCKYWKKGTMTKGVLVGATIAALFAYGLWEQQGCYSYIDASFGETCRRSYEEDERFVGQIEQIAGEDAMIFQLPYMRSFENGMTGNIPDYDHMRGMLHSDTLRWSYGGQSGFKNDIWYRGASMLQPEQLVDELYEKGFAGIWLNLDGYDAEEGAALEARLCAAAHCGETLRCEDGHTVFIPFSQTLVYEVDTLTEEVRSIRYTASETNIQTILNELAGSKVSLRYLEDTLRKNGTNGEPLTVSLPEDGPCHVHRKSPEEKGEQLAIGIVAEGHELTLQDAGTHQITGIPFVIKEDTVYKVDVYFENGAYLPAPDTLIIDFYGGPEYDRAEQEVSGFVMEGRYRYTFYIDSGDMDGDSIDGSVRVFSTDISTPLEVETLRVTETEENTVWKDYSEVRIAASGNDLEPESMGDYQIFILPVELKKNTEYKIELDLSEDTELNEIKDLTFDFYDGPEYDRAEQETHLFIADGQYKYIFYLNAGEYVEETWDAQARVFTYNSNAHVQIDSICVTELEKKG